MSEVKMIYQMPKLDMSSICSVYKGIPDKCMCGCSGKYFYSSTNCEYSGLNRGYAVDENEIDDYTVFKVYNKIKKNEKQGISVIDNSIFTAIIGKTQYTIYLKK